jgi:hypothetical protein
LNDDCRAEGGSGSASVPTPPSAITGDTTCFRS